MSLRTGVSLELFPYKFIVKLGFDHSVGHLICLHFQRKMPIYQSDRGFEDASWHPEWPKAADTVIKA
jgi:hypothetical protein